MAQEPLILDGAYRLLRAAGEGATSNVYLAEEVASGKRVAVKVLKRSLSQDPDMLARFDRESQVLASLRHPNVVGVIRFERAPEGVVLLLDWVDGTRLDVLLAAGPFGAARSLAVLAQVADGLSAVHGAGIVHRDLKPENVMLAAGDVVRLLDFGIARFMEPGKQARSFMTGLGKIAGTPAYFSPEQASGKPADTRSDVYSFGIMAYRMLSGELPFRLGSDAEYLVAHVTEKAPPLVPEDDALKGTAVVELVMQCLEKKPGARPKDGAALAGALREASDVAAKPKKRRWPF